MPMLGRTALDFAALLKQMDARLVVTELMGQGINTVADVSFLAAMLVDKFCCHPSLFRQYQRLREAGVTVSRH
jgi:hypothetical protein